MFILLWSDFTTLSRRGSGKDKFLDLIQSSAILITATFSGMSSNAALQELCTVSCLSIWMNLRCQKKRETVILGNVTDEIFSGNPSSQDRDAMPTVHHHLKTHLWRDTSTWTQVRGGLSVLSSNFGAPQKHCLSSCLGWNQRSCSNKGSYFRETVDTWRVLLQISDSCLKC